MRDQPLPIVLVGGRSRRFGRDKLREPMGDGDWLVDRAVAALRREFGPHVTLVGSCNDELRGRGDAWLDDAWPGTGPMGGILTALERGGDVFVLPGDLPAITFEVVARLRAEADAAPATAWAILAESDRLEPCVGLYRVAAHEPLRARIAAGELRLLDALPPDRVLRISISPSALRNVNVPGDLDTSP